MHQLTPLARLTIRFALLGGAVLATSGCTRPADGGPGAGPGEGPSRTTISVKGSDTMVILGQRWAEDYMKANPTVTVQVTGGGSGTGIAALINGSADVCESSRAMTDKEKAAVLAKRGQVAVETAVALDALAVYVNAKNPVQEILDPGAREGLPR